MEKRNQNQARLYKPRSSLKVCNSIKKIKKLYTIK